MKVKTVDTSLADRKSASVFFSALSKYWDLTNLDALDMFARNGQLTVANYSHLVANVDCWELGPEHEEALRQYPNCREVRIGCSYQHATQVSSKYDLVVLDTPQGLHKDAYGSVRVEHFDALDFSAGLLKPEALVVLYVNKAPYNKNVVGTHGYDEYEEYDFDTWMEFRRRFYEVPNGEVVSEADAIAAYIRAFSRHSYKVVSCLTVPCYSDVPGKDPYAFRLGMHVRAT